VCKGDTLIQVLYRWKYSKGKLPSS